MKQIIVVALLLLLTACETGTKYDRNNTLNVNQELPSGLVDRKEKIEHLLNEDDDRELARFDEEIHNRILEEDSTVDLKTTFSGGTIQDGLEVKEIRQGRHEGYTRLVFDVYANEKQAYSVGNYNVQYHVHHDNIEVVINGYRKFSATMPNFSQSSGIEKIYLGTYLDDSGFKFHIKLQNKAKVRVFDLKQPARLVIDIKPI
jgi:hypothetical protein